MSYVLSLVEKELGHRHKPAGGDNVMFRCPFHKGGQERKPSFSLNTRTGQWVCYTCWYGGGLKKLLYEIGHDRPTVDALIDPVRDQLELRQMIKGRGGLRGGDPLYGPYVLPEELLGVYDFTPVSLVDAGFDEDLLNELDVGYDRARKRVVWPLRDVYGNLIGLSGRLHDSDPDFGRFGKYKIYNKELLELYPDYEKPGHAFLWNMDRIFQLLVTAKTTPTLHVTEGYKAAAWLIQHGFPLTVALMTTNASAEQIRILEMVAADIVLCLDGDTWGIVGSARVGRRLIDSGLSVKSIRYPRYADQLDDVIPVDVPEVVADAVHFTTWKRSLPLHAKEELRKIRKRKERRRWQDDD